MNDPETNPVGRIAVVAVVLASVATAIVGIVSGPAAALSCLTGAAIGVANLWAIGKLVPIMLDDERPGGRRARAAVILALKAIALVGLVGLLVVRRWIRGGPLMVGISVVALAIVLSTLFQRGNGPSTRSLR